MDIRGFFRDRGVQQQVAAFSLTAGIVLAMEAVLFYFSHASHSRERLSELIAQAGALTVSDQEHSAAAHAVASAGPLTRVALRVLCARNAAQVRADNARTARTAALVVLIPLAIGFVWIFRQSSSHGHGRAVMTEAVAVAMGTAVVLAVFHGAAREWRYTSPAETAVDVAHGYFSAVKETRKMKKAATNET